ncbi:MAG: ABC transporter ATP-binding protein, partial [Moorea sp. SIO4A3]|nr:ABC transporter ATP-binding protein [Moorena sp. SIO4A3]
CDRYGAGKPGRIGIMDSGKLIELGTFEQLRHQHGEGLLIKQLNERFEYKFFPTLEQASGYLESLPDKTGVMVRPSNLEDIFVELTGRQLD